MIPVVLGQHYLSKTARHFHLAKAMKNFVHMGMSSKMGVDLKHHCLKYVDILSEQKSRTRPKELRRSKVLMIRHYSNQ